MNLFNVTRDFGSTFQPSRTGVRGTVFKSVAFASDWDESGIAYLLTEDGGLQLSEDHGASWQPPVLNDRLRHLAVAPVAEGGARALLCASMRKVYASLDGGATFRVVHQSKDVHVEAVALSPAFGADRTMFIGLSDGRLMTSSDGGKSWNESKVSAGITHIEVSPDFARDRKLWIATWGVGVQRSDDGGATWTECWTGLSDYEVNEVRVAQTARSYDLFACTRNDGVFYSMDGGTSWTRTPLEAEKTAQTDNHYTSLILSPAWPEDRTVICGTFEGLHISRDGGSTWRESNLNPSRIGRIIAISKNYAEDKSLFAAGYGMQLLASEDGGDSWELRFTNINAKSVYAIAPSPDYHKRGQIIMGATRGVRASTDRASSWEFLKFPQKPNDNPANWYTTRAVTYAVDYPEDPRVYTTTTLGRLYLSNDQGANWSPINDAERWTTGICLSPKFSEDDTMYLSGSGVWMSTDAGKTFEGPLYPFHFLGNNLVCSPDFEETGELFGVVRYKGFVVGSDRGRSWSVHNDGLEGFMPMSMKLSPSFVDDSTAFLLTSGGGLFRSRDRGRSWEKVSKPGGPLDQAFTLAVSPDFANDQTMFAGTYSGIMRSRDGGVTWEDTLRTEFYDDVRDPWMFEGAWERRFGGLPYGLCVRQSKQIDAQMVLEFDGVGCRLIGARGPNLGVAEVSLDGEVVARVDQYAPEREWQHVMYEIDGLELGSHKLVVRVTGEKAEAARDHAVHVDAAFVHYR